MAIESREWLLQKVEWSSRGNKEMEFKRGIEKGNAIFRI
jgi:hypothetical protein